VHQRSTLQSDRTRRGTEFCSSAGEVYSAGSSESLRQSDRIRRVRESNRSAAPVRSAGAPSSLLQSDRRGWGREFCRSADPPSSQHNPYFWSSGTGALARWGQLSALCQNSCKHLCPGCSELLIALRARGLTTPRSSKPLCLDSADFIGAEIEVSQLQALR
jgi:hypothetical protein